MPTGQEIRTPEFIAQQRMFLAGRKYEYERANDEARSTILQNEKRIEFIDKWLAQLDEAICRNCKGHGMVQVWYAQDDCKAETCDVCMGSGIRTVQPK